MLRHSARLDRATIACFVTLGIKDGTDESVLGPIFFRQFFLALTYSEHLNMPDIREIKEKAYDEGYNQAEKDWQIWYYCAACGERIDMDPNDDDHKAMIGYMKEHGWGHASCVD